MKVRMLKTVKCSRHRPIYRRHGIGRVPIAVSGEIYSAYPTRSIGIYIVCVGRRLNLRVHESAFKAIVKDTIEYLEEEE